MSPVAALALCTAFVLFLLRQEQRLSRGLSPALWVPTLWILMIGSRSLGAWFGITGQNDSGNLLDQLALSGLTLAGLLVIAKRRMDWSGILRRHLWLLALLTYMLVSTLWSDITLVAIKRW